MTEKPAIATTSAMAITYRLRFQVSNAGLDKRTPHHSTRKTTSQLRLEPEPGARRHASGRRGRGTFSDLGLSSACDIMARSA